MQLTTQSLTVDLNNRILQTLYAKQYDSQTRQVKIKLALDGQVISIPSTTSISLKVATPEPSYFSYPAKETDNFFTVVDNEISFLIPNDVLNVAGRTSAELTLYDDNTSISTANFYIMVEAAPYDYKTIVTGEGQSALNKLLSENQELTQNSEEYARTAVSYAVGEYYNKPTEEDPEYRDEFREGETTDNAKYYYQNTRSFTFGDTNYREGENTDNAKYFWQQTRSLTKGDNGIRDGEETDNAEYYYKNTRSYSVGDTDYRDGEAEDNSKYFYNNTKTYYNDVINSRQYLTKAEYTALGDIVNSNNVDYYTIDEETSGTFDARYVRYDNNNSYLESEQVQAALDELTYRLGDLSFKAISQTSYNELETKDDNTIYFIYQ